MNSIKISRVQGTRIWSVVWHPGPGWDLVHSYMRKKTFASSWHISPAGSDLVHAWQIKKTFWTRNPRPGMLKPYVFHWNPKYRASTAGIPCTRKKHWPHEKKHFWHVREKTFVCFRTVSGLQNLVHASDAKLQIKFASPKGKGGKGKETARQG